MADLSGLLKPDRVFVDLESSSKRQVLQTLAEELSASISVESGQILKALLEREKLGTTGIGDGLAIPHAKLDDLDEVVGCFVRLGEQVDFDALDEKPVDLVFCLLAPQDSGAEHLKALAKVARVFRDEQLCNQLRQNEKPSRLYDLLVPRASSNAA